MGLASPPVLSEVLLVKILRYIFVGFRMEALMSRCRVCGGERWVNFGAPDVVVTAPDGITEIVVPCPECGGDVERMSGIM